MNQNAEDRQAVRRFFMSYFHQDWDLMASSTGEAVGHFLRDAASPQAVLAVARGIRAVLDSTPDVNLRQVLRVDLGCDVTPFPEVGGRDAAREWLETIVDLLCRPPIIQRS